jgi:hypothetical protein
VRDEVIDEVNETGPRTPTLRGSSARQFGGYFQRQARGG